MTLNESLGNLMQQCVAGGNADNTTVSTLMKYARDIGYFSSIVEVGPTDPPPATPAVVLTAVAQAATVAEAAIAPVLVDVTPVIAPTPQA